MKEKIRCALCNEEKEPKSNTHYLTDSIIRTCLNEDGKNIREKGFYSDFSSPIIKPKFQRNTSPEKIKGSLGREPTDEEIENAKKEIPFSVSDKFCKECENKFTKIETNFTNKYLDSFRKNKYTGSQISFKDNKIIKLFFLLQIWRVSICESFFKLEINTAEKIRDIICNNDSIDKEKLNEFPISVTYLITPSIKDYTGNLICHTNDINPNVIIMNDFVIQFFHNCQSIKYFCFFGLNKLENYKDYINTDSEEFIFRIFNNEERESFNKKVSYELAENYINFYSSILDELHLRCFGKPAPDDLKAEFINSLKGIVNLTDDNMLISMKKFIMEKYNIKH